MNVCMNGICEVKRYVYICLSAWVGMVINEIELIYITN